MVPRFRAMWLIVLLIWVTRSLPAITDPRGRLGGNGRSHGDTAHGTDLFSRAKATKGLKRRPRDVHRIGRAKDLGQDVPDACGLDDGADCAAGDDTGTLGGWLQHDLRGAEVMPDFVRDRGPHHRDFDQMLLCVLDALADGLGHFAGLTKADAHVTRAVTDDLGLIGLLLAWGPELLFEARGGGQRLTGGVVDYLGRDVFVAAEYDQARALGRAREAKPDPLMPLLARGHAAADLRHRAGPFVMLGRLTSCRRSCRPCRPCGGSSHLDSARPCPCTVRACD